MDCISFSIYFRSGCIKHEPRSPPSESAILPASYGSSSSRRSTRDSEPSLLASCFSFSIYWLFEFPVSTFIVQHHCCGRKENVHHWFLRKSALGGQRPSTATPIRASFCHRTGACRSLSQPLSRVSRKQRYNTLDFASKIVCQQGCSRPYWKPCVKGDSPPLNTPYFLRCEYPSCKNTVWNTCSENAKEAVLSHNTCVVELLSFIELQHQTGSAKPVQYLHSCRLIVAQFLEGKLPDLG